MLTHTHHHRFRRWTLAVALVLGVVLMAQTSMAQGSGEDYDVTILSMPSTSPGQDKEIIVRVRTPQGAPAHGVPVTFHLDPDWEGDATIVPEQTTTDHGIARATLRTDLIGYVELTVQVGAASVFKQTGFASSLVGDDETSVD